MKEKLDINSQEYWENILESEGLGDLDLKLGIKKSGQENLKNSSKKIKKDTEIILNSKNFEEYFLKKYPNFNFNVNYEIGEINIYDKKNNLLVGHIGPGEISIPGYEGEEHLYFEVDEKYSGKGIGKFLYDTYLLLSKEYKNFVMPKIDYVSSPSMLNFYLKNEIYSIVSEYNIESKTFEELDISEIEKLKKEKLEKYYDKNGNRRFFRLSN